VFVGEMELGFYLLLDAGKDVAVDVVDEVEGSEEDESGGGSGYGGGAGGFGLLRGRGGHLAGRIAGGVCGFFIWGGVVWFCLGISGFLVVLVWWICGENVVACVADVVFQQSVSGALKMRQVFGIYFSGHGHSGFRGCSAGSGGATMQVLPDIFFHSV
jgi:hypothetical protein